MAVIWAILAFQAESPIASLSLMLLSVRGTGMLWAAAEAFRYSAMLRRRVALGLSEPGIAHRFWLWGIGAAAQTLVISLDFGSWLVHGSGLDQLPLGVAATALIGLVGSIAVALAFFPPARYLEAVLRRADASQSTVSA